MFIKFRKKLNKKGFTLIELLIVVAIIGILAAIAIPQFSAYRIRGYNSAAHSDAKNIVTSEEAYFVDNQAYLAVAIGTALGALPGAKLSQNVKAKVVEGAVEGAFYSAGTAHTQGDKIYTMESEEGKFYWLSKTAGIAWDGSGFTAATTNSDIADTNPA